MIKSRSEEFLIEQELFKRRSANQRQILGCIACRWHAQEANDDPPKTYAFEIARCSGNSGSRTGQILRRLVEGDVLTEQQEDRSQRGSGATRVLFKPADTELGAAFAASLEVPGECGLQIQDKAPAPATTDTDTNPPATISEIIAASSREELTEIIKLVSDQLRLLAEQG